MHGDYAVSQKANLCRCVTNFRIKERHSPIYFFLDSVSFMKTDLDKEYSETFG